MHEPFDIKLFVENVLAINPYISAQEMSTFLARKGHQCDVKTIQDLMCSISQAQNRA